ncbi:hypothetical protein CX658_31840 [Pseudomonas amygdali pv. lachrymans]|nr:hypothetical protein CX658_32195 [Pseudomonas amygdali pv. lachrymans]PWC98808.1 hypothetical protein CX658_31840 [Pseudomonas amygdali pv. lachrymans]
MLAPLGSMMVEPIIDRGKLCQLEQCEFANSKDWLWGGDEPDFRACAGIFIHLLEAMALLVIITARSSEKPDSPA